MARVAMKSPLLFSLFVWVFLLVCPWTRPMALLDWKRVTTGRVSDFVPAWAPRDAPLLPGQAQDDQVPPVHAALLHHEGAFQPGARAEQLTVALQFAGLARSSNDRDVLLWCALSPQDGGIVTDNLQVLARHFPRDAALLAWASTARVAVLNLQTRARGPFTGGAAWSVRPHSPMGSPSSAPVLSEQKRWNILAQAALRGQAMEPRNGYWWWLETIALLGARRDEQLWPVLRAGGQKPFYDSHANDLRRALWRARVQAQGVMPVAAALKDLEQGDWREVHLECHEATCQVCENIISARLLGRHKTALEGGRDLARLAALLMHAKDDSSTYEGVAVQSFALQHAQVSAVGVKQLQPGGSASAHAFAGHPGSLLRYATEQKRGDIARELSAQWNALSAARRALTARYISSNTVPFAELGLDNISLALAAGVQNTGALLASTLPLPLLILALGGLRALWRPVPEEEASELPSWTRGLGWSAFSIAVLLGANFALSSFLWRYYDSQAGTKTPLAFNAITPRLAGVLPAWTFGFPALVASVGALWASVHRARRQHGELPLQVRLKNSLASPDERLQSFDARPWIHLIALSSAWAFGIAALAAWFYWPQVGALESQSHRPTLHDQAGSFSLIAFYLAVALPVLFLRPKGAKRRPALVLRSPIWRRFLAAHIALATLLYLACNIGGAIFGARFEAGWSRVFAPTTSGEK